MRRILIYFFLLIPIRYAFSTDLNQTMNQANLDYTSGKYENAVSGYEKVINAGFESVNVYYNLGNAYYKLNKLPEAILFYEKARKISPGDDDITFNLKVANSRIVDKIEILPELFYVRYWKSLMSWYSVDQWAKISIGFFVLFFLTAGFYLYSRKLLVRIISFWTGLSLFLLTLLSLTITSRTYQLKVNTKEAIIFAPSLTVKSSPDEASIDIFVLHEGTKVLVSDQLGSWVKITIANGSVGWVPESEMKVI